MDDRSRHLHDALERAIERFRDERDTEPSIQEVDDRVLEDLASKYSTVSCPIHGTPPRFDVENRAVREWFCCETLLSLVRELSRKDALDH